MISVARILPALSVMAAVPAVAQEVADAPNVAARYWAGCEAGDASALPAYWRDFAPVATKSEIAAWSAVGSLADGARVAAACDVLRRGWAERAVRTGLAVAGRIDLHFERLRYAREHYRLIAAVRLGPRTRLLSEQVGRPPGVDLDDRGLIYVRLGEPDRTARFGGGQGSLVSLPRVHSVESPDDRAIAWRQAAYELVVSPECYHPNESWAYDFPGGTRIFHFSSLEGAADWWLIENLHDVYRCGDPSRAVTLYGGPEDYQAATSVLTPVSGGGAVRPGAVAWLVLPELYMSRSALDARYGTAAARIMTGGPNDIGEMDELRNVGPDALVIQDLFAEERTANFDAAAAVLTSLVERPPLRAEAPLLYETLQFRAPGAQSEAGSRLWVNAVAHGYPLRGERTAEGGYRYAVRATLGLLDESGEMRRREALFTLRSPAVLEEGAGVPVRLYLDVPPGEYFYTLVLRDGNDERERPVGNWRGDSLLVRSYAAAVPQLSDIAVAPDSGGTTILAPGVALSITPLHVTNASGEVWLYFEAYELSPAGPYDIEVRIIPGDDGEPFTLVYRGAAPAASAASVGRVLRLDLSDSPPGDYAVRVRVTDALGRTSLPIETDLRVRW